MFAEQGAMTQRKTSVAKHFSIGDAQSSFVRPAQLVQKLYVDHSPAGGSIKPLQLGWSGPILEFQTGKSRPDLDFD